MNSQKDNQPVNADEETESTHRFIVRFPTQVRDRVAAAAKYHRRSMNSEIVARLEQSFIGLPNQPVEDRTQFHSTLEAIFNSNLSKQEETVLIAFRHMPRDKQQALVDLLT